MHTTIAGGSQGAAAAAEAGIAAIVDLDRYPIADLASAEGRRVVAEGRAQLARNGLCLLPDFIRPATLLRMVDEARALHAGSHYEEEALTDSGSERPDVFKLPKAVRNASSAVAYDRIATDSPIRRLYEWDGLVALFRALLGTERLYRCADPIISCLLMYYGDGDELGWHFDPNDGVVTLLLQAPERGGAFEFVPDVPHEGRSEIVTRVMEGERGAVVAPLIAPGTLSLFRGLNSLHRVTRAEGPRPRIILTMSFDPEPGMQFSDRIRRRYSGRVA